MNNVVDFKPRNKKKTPTPDFTIKPIRDFATLLSVVVLIATGFALMGSSFMGIVAIGCAAYMILKSEETNRER